MNCLKTVFVLFLLFVGLSTNTAQSADPLNYIPKQAQNVYVLNLPSILPKMDIQTLKKLDFFQEIIEKANNKEAAKYLNNPAESGINFLKPMAIVMSPMEGTAYQVIATITPLANPAKFKTLMATSENKIVEKNGLNVIAGDTSVLAWNAQMFVTISLKKPKEDPLKAMLGQSDSTATVEILPKLDPSVYFQNSETNSKADAMRELMKTPHDIYIYQTTDGAGGGMKGMVASMALGLKPTDLDGNITSGWADFENGRIVGEMSQKLNDAMAQKFKGLGRAKPSVDWNNYINPTDGKKTFASLSISINPMGFKELISENAMLKQGVEKAAASKSKDKSAVDKIFAMFGGDIFATMAMGENGMDMLFGVSIADKKGFEKILKDEFKAKSVGKNIYVLDTKKPVVTEDAVVPVPEPPTDGDMPSNGIPKNMPISQPKPKSPMLVLLRDNVALIGKESQILALSAAPKVGVLKPITTEWQKSLKNKPFNLYLDFNALSAAIGPMTQGKLDGLPIESMSMSQFNRVSTFELKMVDKDKNAITAFFTYIDTMVKKEKEKKAALEKLKKEGEETEEKTPKKDGDGN